jgi:hypothetical protein
VYGSAKSDAADPAPARGPGLGPPRQRSALRPAAVVAAVYLAAHAALLPPALEDIDSINFALGLRDFDPVQHQPHPPGYPVYIALGKTSKAALERIAPASDPQATDARALSIWSALAGAACLLLLVPMLRYVSRLTGADLRPHAVPLLLVLAAAPLFWMSGLRPLSDMPGLAAALGAQVLLLRACVAGVEATRPSLAPLAIAAAAAGLAMGVRSQVLWLAAPLVVAAIVCTRRAGMVRAALAGSASAAAGALVWAVPLAWASGGLQAYLAALDGMARADFANVRMLATTPSVRALALALADTFVRPWGAPELAIVALTPAVLGGVVLLWRMPGVAGWMLLMFGPYLGMHLLFQETEHIRYGLPVVVPVAWLAAAFATFVGRRFALAAAAAMATASLLVVVPASRVYAAQPLPASAALAAALDGQRREGGVIAAHFDFARLLAVARTGPATVLPAPVFGERSQLLAYWMARGRGPVWFLANPARTDLELIDPASRQVRLRSAWALPRDWFLGGIRPARGDLVRIESPPGWVAGEGWHLTRETLILSERRGRPDATLFVRRREEPAVALLGGELVASAPGEGAAVTVTLDGHVLASVALDAASPRFSTRLAFPPGSLAGADPFVPLRVAWRAEPAGRMPRLHLTHVDLQAPDRPFWVYSHGWHDRELDPRTEREWRWTSGRADVRVHTAGFDVDMQIDGEVPIADLESPPAVTISAGGTLLRTMRPDGAFSAALRIPADVVDAAGGVLTIATDRTFVPGARTGSGDLRELGLRIYRIRVGPVTP